VKLFFLFFLIFCNSISLSHGVFNGDLRVKYINKILDSQSVIQKKTSKRIKANAYYEIGIILERIKKILNDEILSHGQIQDLEKFLLIEQLKTNNLELSFSKKKGLFKSNLDPLKKFLILAPENIKSSDAAFLIFKNTFFDNFLSNPLEPLNIDKKRIIDMIKMGENLLARNELKEEKEEILFLLAVFYLQAKEYNFLEKKICDDKISEIIQIFKDSYSKSEKLLTLEYLNKNKN